MSSQINQGIHWWIRNVNYLVAFVSYRTDVIELSKIHRVRYNGFAAPSKPQLDTTEFWHIMHYDLNNNFNCFRHAFCLSTIWYVTAYRFFWGKRSLSISLICFILQNQNYIHFLNIEKLSIANPHSFECHKANFSQVYPVSPSFPSRQCKTADFYVSLIENHSLLHVHLGPRTSTIERWSQLAKNPCCCKRFMTFCAYTQKLLTNSKWSCDLVSKIHRFHSGFNFRGVTQSSSWDFNGINPKEESKWELTVSHIVTNLLFNV